MYSWVKERQEFILAYAGEISLNKIGFIMSAKMWKYAFTGHGKELRDPSIYLTIKGVLERPVDEKIKKYIDVNKGEWSFENRWCNQKIIAADFTEFSDVGLSVGNVDLSVIFSYYGGNRIFYQIKIDECYDFDSKNLPEDGDIVNQIIVIVNNIAAELQKKKILIQYDWNYNLSGAALL